jgi:hypothetical protein
MEGRGHGRAARGHGCRWSSLLLLIRHIPGIRRPALWLGRQALFGLASTRCSSGQRPKARPTIPAQPPKSSGMPTGLPNSYSSNAECRPSTKPTLTGRIRTVGQRPPGSPVRPSEQSASRPWRRWAPSARHNLLKFRHDTCKRRDGGADLMV